MHTYLYAYIHLLMYMHKLYVQVKYLEKKNQEILSDST